MDLFTYLMAKKGHNTHRDLFSYLLGKNAGGSGTYTTFSGTSLNISNTLQAKIKNIALEGNTSQDGTPTPDTPVPIKVVTGEQNVEIKNSDSTLSQTYPLSLGNIELAKIGNYKDYIFKNVVGSPYYNANLDLNGWYKHNAIYKYVVTGNEIFNNNFGVNLFEISNAFEQVPFVKGYGLSNYYKYNSTQGEINGNTSNGDFVLQYDRGYCNLFFKNTSFDNVTDFKNDLQDKYNNDNPIIIMFPLKNPIDTQITDTTLISQLENINNNARSYKGTTIIECTSESADNETIGFSGDIKVTSVGNSLNTSLLSSNLQEETNIDDIQEEPNLDEIEDIEQNDELTENEEIEEKVS